MKMTRLVLLMCVGLLWAGQALAQNAAAMPEWDKLTPQQREMLIAPLRDRWNNDPAGRVRMLEHAQGWQQMTPEQRKQARRGVKRFEDMTPEQRDRARALFAHMRGLPPEEREKLREQWQNMTPEQRNTWLQQHPPRDVRPDR